TLLVLAAFSPWMLLKLIPFTEVAAGVGGALQHHRDGFRRYAEYAGALDVMRAAPADAEGDVQLPGPQPGDERPMPPPAPRDNGAGDGGPVGAGGGAGAGGG